MISTLFAGTTMPLLQQVARFTERRQDVLAGNLANVSTPDYRARDLPVESFQKALKEAVGGHLKTAGSSEGTWQFQSAAPSAADGNAFDELLFQAAEAPPQGITFHDGNNRSIEHLMMEMTKNSLLYNSAVELMKMQLNRLQAVISERA